MSSKADAPKASAVPEKKATAPRGVSKSGRKWKNVRTQKPSVVKVKPLKSSWDRKLKDKTKQRIVKEVQDEIRTRLTEEKQAKIERRKENERRREENAKKAEIVQVIKNTNKLKRVKKKMLRQFATRDLDAPNAPKTI